MSQTFSSVPFRHRFCPLAFSAGLLQHANILFRNKFRDIKKRLDALAPGGATAANSSTPSTAPNSPAPTPGKGRVAKLLVASARPLPSQALTTRPMVMLRLLMKPVSLRRKPATKKAKASTSKKGTAKPVKKTAKKAAAVKAESDAEGGEEGADGTDGEEGANGTKGENGADGDGSETED